MPGHVRSLIGVCATAAVIAGALLAWSGAVRPLVGFAIFALGGLVALLIALASLVQAARGRGVTLGGTLAIVIAVVFVAAASRGRGHPRINDFTTDLDDPPTFTFARSFPDNAGRDLAYPREFAPIQRACCADLHPVHLPLPPEQAYLRVLAVSSLMPGWRITSADAMGRTIEAVDTSRLFHFQDDIVLRVRADGDGSRVDVRSKSRDGKGDLGVNATRIRAITQRLETSS